MSELNDFRTYLSSFAVFATLLGMFLSTFLVAAI